MNTIKKKDWQALPEQAQQGVYDFFLHIKQRYNSKSDQSETIAYRDKK